MIVTLCVIFLRNCSILKRKGCFLICEKLIIKYSGCAICFDPFRYYKDSFFPDSRTLFKKSPKINGKDIDLYLLYVVVTAHGGWIKVSVFFIIIIKLKEF